MRITLLLTGKTDTPWIKAGMEEYTARLSHYIRFSVVEIAPQKNFRQLSPLQLKEAEGKLMLKYLAEADQVVLLDESGQQRKSEDFAAWLQKMMNAGTRHMIFVVGGAYGFSPEIHAAASHKLSLSSMTFSHQMVRPFFIEQLYRAFTILRNEPYHNS